MSPLFALCYARRVRKKTAKNCISRGGYRLMPEFLRKDFQLHVGWRTIKTAVSAMLVAIVYCLIGRNPAFACIRYSEKHECGANSFHFPKICLTFASGV